MAHPDPDPMWNEKREKDEGELRAHWEHSRRQNPGNWIVIAARFPELEV